jgi:hypothetical protein
MPIAVDAFTFAAMERAMDFCADAVASVVAVTTFSYTCPATYAIFVAVTIVVADIVLAADLIADAVALTEADIVRDADLIADADAVADADIDFVTFRTMVAADVTDADTIRPIALRAFAVTFVVAVSILLAAFIADAVALTVEVTIFSNACATSRVTDAVVLTVAVKTFRIVCVTRRAASAVAVRLATIVLDADLMTSDDISFTDDRTRATAFPALDCAFVCAVIVLPIAWMMFAVALAVAVTTRASARRADAET